MLSLLLIQPLAATVAVPCLPPQAPLAWPSRTPGTESGPSLTWVDYDADGLPDLFIADPLGGDHLLRNRGQGAFEERFHLSGLDVSSGSRLAAWADFDADGLPDVYRVAPDRRGELYRNMGDGTLAPVGEFVGLPQAAAVLDAAWVDLDADTHPDLELVTPEGACLFSNHGGSFTRAFELPLAAGGESEAQPGSGAPEPGTSVRPAPAASAGAAPAKGAPGSSPASGPAAAGTTKVGSRKSAPSSQFCAYGVQDQTLGGSCITASSTPLLGQLYPLSTNLFVATSGNVGIGTTAPMDRLDVAGTLRATGLRLPTGAQNGWVLTSDGSGTGSWQPVPGGGVGGSGTTGYLSKFATSGTITDSVLYESGGRLGAGTTSPYLSTLHLKASIQDAALRLEGTGVNGSNGRLAFGSTDLSTYVEELEDDGIYVVAPAGVGLGPGNVGVHTAVLADATHALTVAPKDSSQVDILRLIGPGTSYGEGAELNFGDGDYVKVAEDVDDHLLLQAQQGTRIQTTGIMAVPALEIQQDVGSGSSSPALHLTNTSTGLGLGVFSETYGSDANAVFTQHGTGPIIKGYSNGLTFEVRNDGRVACKAVEIQGGSDVVESFQTDVEVVPGTVVCIDPDHPGALTPSREPYDARVAGVVSGAGGIEPGLHLYQKGVTELGQPVAMAGRVYVRCTAENGPIRPGDLLTTSSLPGRAMRATDAGRSFGAVIGKAMTALDEDEGQGLVLVLVNLQ